MLNGHENRRNSTLKRRSTAPSSYRLRTLHPAALLGDGSPAIPATLRTRHVRAARQHATSFATPRLLIIASVWDTAAIYDGLL